MSPYEGMPNIEGETLKKFLSLFVKLEKSINEIKSFKNLEKHPSAEGLMKDYPTIEKSMKMLREIYYLEINKNFLPLIINEATKKESEEGVKFYAEAEYLLNTFQGDLEFVLKYFDCDKETAKYYEIKKVGGELDEAGEERLRETLIKYMVEIRGLFANMEKAKNLVLEEYPPRPTPVPQWEIRKN
jgi:hypothetical protein